MSSVGSAHEKVRSIWRMAGRARPRSVGDHALGGSRNEGRVTGLGDDLADELDGRARDRPVVQTAFPQRRVANRKRAGCPHRAVVQLANRLQRGDPPGRCVLGDRPVERGRATVADRSRMNDDRAIASPQIIGNSLPQERADDKRRIESRARGPHRVHIRTQVNANVMASGAEIEPYSLAQSVERRAKQHDAHGRFRWLGR